MLERLCGEKDKTAVMDEAATLYSLVEKIEQERRTRRFDKFILPFIKADDPEQASWKRWKNSGKTFQFVLFCFNLS